MSAIGQAAWILASRARENFVAPLRLPGTAGAYASTPNHASLQITGDLDIRALARPASWSGATYVLVAKNVDAGNQQSFQFRLEASGSLRLLWSTSGAGGGGVSAISTANPTPPVSGPLWMRATLDVDDGSGGWVVRFYTSPDGVAWDQLGDSITGVGTTSIYASTAVLEVGSRNVGVNNVFAGDVYAVELRDGIDGTIVANPDFTAPANQWISAAGMTMLDGAGRTWTLNGSGWGWPGSF